MNVRCFWITLLIASFPHGVALAQHTGTAVNPSGYNLDEWKAFIDSRVSDVISVKNGVAAIAGDAIGNEASPTVHYMPIEHAQNFSISCDLLLGWMTIHFGYGEEAPGKIITGFNNGPRLPLPSQKGGPEARGFADEICSYAANRAKSKLSGR